MYKNRVNMEEDIHQWMADYTEGSIRQEDFVKLKKWVEEKPEHEVIFNDCLRLYRNAREIGFVDRMNDEQSWKKLNRKLNRQRRIVFARIMVAASILLIGIIGGEMLSREKDVTVAVTETIPGRAPVILYMADGKSVDLKEGKILELIEKDGTEISSDTLNTLIYHADKETAESVLHTVEVPVGGEFDLELADGTQVWLNSDTKFRFPTRFSGNTREVYVEGEAYFSVSKNTCPFIVYTGDVEVKVLGTEFNLSAYPGEKIVTTLTKGKVEVIDEQNSVSLKSGEQAICYRGVSNIDVREVNAALYSSWIKGVFEFENMSLWEITKQLSRWYGVIFEFDDTSGKRCFTGGIKKYVPLHRSLDILEKTTDVKFKIKDNVIFVQSKK